MEGVARLRELRLSKYNAAPSRETLSRCRVLVLDQTEGDASIAGAMANTETFTAMLDAAVAYAGAEGTAVKLHPETVSGRKRGHLKELAAARGVRVIDPHHDSWSALESADEVWTVSSQLGFEALLAGLPVRCFGVPFYAGWGLTRDSVACTRRTGRPSLEALAAAVLIRYSRYLEPWDRRPIAFEEAIDALALLRDRFHEIRGRPAVAGIANRGKRRTLTMLLKGLDGEAEFHDDLDRALSAARSRGTSLVLWGDAHRDLGKDTDGPRIIRAEDGFLRSDGLGAAFVPSMSLVFDDLGIHYDPGRPSRIEQLLADAEVPPRLLERARALRETLVKHRITKYGAAPRGLFTSTEDGREKILVVGQVADDASIRLGAPGLTNEELLRRARKRHPDAFLVYRPHPDVTHGYRKGAVAREVSDALADATLPRVPMPDLLDWCDRVETATSLAGFEALMRGRQVTLHGTPFYAGWGLTEDLVACPRRGRRLDLDELVAISLILYPRYVDYLSKLPCSPEIVVRRLLESKKAAEGPYIRSVHLTRHVMALLRHRIVGPAKNAWRRRRAIS